jgi:hypothetical protein
MHYEKPGAGNFGCLQLRNLKAGLKEILDYGWAIIFGEATFPKQGHKEVLPV